MKNKNTGKNTFDPAVIAQFVKYGLVGLLNTGITLAVIFILTKLFHVSDYIANAAGYVAGFVNSFLWNKLWTFKSRGNLLMESLLFVLVFAVCYAIQLGVLAFQIEILKWNRDIAQILSMAVYTVIGFAGNKLVTFRKGAKK